MKKNGNFGPALVLFALGGLVNCSGRDAAPDPSNPSGEGGKDQGDPAPAPGGGGPGDVAGGQSGGTSGGHPGPACYCSFGPLARARLVDAGAAGGCAVFELLEPPAEAATDYYGLSVGDRFGGQAEFLCGQPFELEEGEEVYVRYIPGATSGSECPEYRSCSSTECGDPSELDGLPSEEYETRAVEYDRCDTACLESTRDACESHLEESRFSGRLLVARFDASGDVVFVNGETYAVPPEELYDPNCRPEGVPEPQIPSDSPTNGDSAPAADAPPPQPAPGSAVCPVPDAEQ